jgi:RNA polymerase sigma factor for flagellar operon FliA
MPADKETLIQAHIPLVHQYVRELLARVPTQLDSDDLTAAGLLALVRTAIAFDPDRGVPFPSFADLRLRGALLDELRALDGTSRGTRQLLRRVRFVAAPMLVALGRVPTTHELSEYLGLSETELREAIQEAHRANTVHLQDLCPETVANLVRDEEPGPEERWLDRELVTELHKAIEALPPRLGRVVVEYFIENRTMAAIALDLAVTRSRVSQLCSDAVARLRTRFAVPEPPTCEGVR